MKLIDFLGRFCYYLKVVRKCWNWQTGKTKDLVLGSTCGFKSHLPHWFKLREALILKAPRFLCFGRFCFQMFPTPKI